MPTNADGAGDDRRLQREVLARVHVVRQRPDADRVGLVAVVIVETQIVASETTGPRSVSACSVRRTNARFSRVSGKQSLK